MALPLSVRTEVLALGLVAVMMGVLGAPVAAWADGSAPRERVAIAPDLRAFIVDGGQVEGARDYHRAIRRGAEGQWRTNHRPVEVVSWPALHQEVAQQALYEGTLELAREWGAMGMEAYKRVRTQEAVDYLERALQNFETIAHDLVDPDEVAEILMYLALSYLEEGTNVMRPIQVFQKMVGLAPWRQLQRGYYPDFIVQYYESARDNLWRRLRDDGPSGQQSARVAQLLDADYVFHGYLFSEGAGEGVELVAYLYDVAAQALMPPERLRLEVADAEAIEEGFARLASRLAICLVEEEGLTGEVAAIAASRGTSRLAVDLGLNYSAFWDYPAPIRDVFGHYGVSLGASWSMTREFEVFATVAVANSLRDYSGRLREDFATVGAGGGLRLGRHFGPAYLGLGAGLKVMQIGPVRAFTDPGCIADPDRLCPGGVGTVLLDEQGLHWGVELRPRVAWSVANSFQIWSALGAGYFIAPLEGQLFNFPMTTEVGVNYRF